MDKLLNVINAPGSTALGFFGGFIVWGMMVGEGRLPKDPYEAMVFVAAVACGIAGALRGPSGKAQ